MYKNLISYKLAQNTYKEELSIIAKKVFNE